MFRTALVSAGAVVVGGALAGCELFGGDDDKKTQQENGMESPLALLPEFDTSQERNVLAEGTWKFLPGAESTDKGLRLTHTGLSIRKEKDTWAREDVPEHFLVVPLNAWTHVQADKPGGDVGIAARITDISGKATVVLQSQPTLRYDERIWVRPGVSVEIEGSTATVRVWQGKGEEPELTETIDLGSPVNTADVAVAQIGDSLVVSTNGKKKVLPASILKSGQVWFGMDASDSWGLSALRAYPIGDTKIETVDSTRLDFGKLDPKGLQATVAHKRPDLIIGSAIDNLTYDLKYAQLVMANAGGLATEMLAKPQNFQPERGRLVWADYDAFVELTQKHGKKIHVHTPVFEEANPAWMEEAVANGTPEEALEIMTSNITALLSRHRGKVHTVDVVNEPFSPVDDQWDQLREHMWLKKIGPRYIEEAFRAAHKADPDALLFLNDWGFEHDPDRWEGLMNLLDDLQAKGVPIHGIGFQAHLDPDDINEILGSDILAERFKQLEERGLKVRISEISIEGIDPQRQAEAYAKVLRTCMRAKNCIGFNMWGMASNEAYFTTWPNGSNAITRNEYGNDAPWQRGEDGSYRKKPAANALFDAAQRA